MKAGKQLIKAKSFRFGKSAVTNKAGGRYAGEIVSLAYRDEIVSPQKSTATYRQGRVVAPTVEEALARIKERFPGLERVTVFACPVQPWPEGIWWEWLGKDGKAGQS